MAGAEVVGGDLPPGVEIRRPPVVGSDRVLTRQALAFVADLQRRFGPTRIDLLRRRGDRQAELDAGVRPGFLQATRDVRASDWTVAPAPPDLDDRRVEITGPAEAKMMINALNSGARVFMADLEDALSPTWDNVIGGQVALADAVRGTLRFDSPEGKSYRLADRTATLVVRPRGWHLVESGMLVDGVPVSASLFDFGLFLFHCGPEAIRRGSGPYLYLAKLESHDEARLWNDVFVHAQTALGLRQGSIRATVLIETILAAFEMDEILYELRAHSAGLNAGRWDYLFSGIKKLRAWPALEVPDRAQLTMTVPFMRAYTELLVRTCHRRGAHAIGGMAAFIPNRRDPDVTEVALARVREDKERESRDGFDGTWVAHPDLVPVAMEVFDGVLGAAPNQKHRLREDVSVSAADLLDLTVPGGMVTETGVRADVRVALAYLDSWLRGTGAAAIDNLMEDAATAEIARSQLWHWRTREIALPDGRVFDAALYGAIRDEEVARLGGVGEGRLADAVALLDDLVLDDEFAEFLTLRAYCDARLDRASPQPRSGDRATLDEPAEAPATDERTGADDRPPAHEHVPHRARDSQPFVWRVVARVVEIGGADGPLRSRVEQHEVRVTSDLDRSLGPQSEPGGGRRRQQVDHPLETDPALGHALAVEDREQRFDAWCAVADPVERDTPPGLRLLRIEPVRNVIGRDQVERAVGQTRPQRVAIGRRPQWWRDDVAGARRRDRDRRIDRSDRTR